MTAERRVPREHTLKCWPEFWEAIARGEKTFELRNDDRGFRAGDTLILHEWLPTAKEYTGRELRRFVPYLVPGQPWLAPNYVCMSLAAPAAPAWEWSDAEINEYMAAEYNHYYGAGQGDQRAPSDVTAFERDLFRNIVHAAGLSAQAAPAAGDKP